MRNVCMNLLGLTKPQFITASVHPDDSASYESFSKLGATTLTENIPVVKNSDAIFVAVKPYVVSDVLNEIKAESEGKLFLSVAMGITIDAIEKSLSSKSRVVRVMPNTPALVQCGCSVFVRGSKATQEDLEVTSKLLSAIGTCEEVNENLLDPITALSSSGPAFVFVMIESLADGAVRMGLPRDLAYRLASQTVLGSGKLVRDSKIHPGQLKDDVTSPAGCTAAGLNHLELSGFRSAVAGAVEAATKRCNEISGM
ncbi:pyrroline-5-carboxylate reductase 1, mitochondrial isoform X2 [Eupeodes corollae]|uniref:pyrroline-5-carboxylate reductase 1, mitochondrial isoform X2 n=1 Tax=Eupeodes corollae TaxID=290404 RepID=UPI002490057E|nr:pyrroline-5-carboxylate reductase 1, mitochondrial isoform X2 [Eupeodes corollae]